MVYRCTTGSFFGEGGSKKPSHVKREGLVKEVDLESCSYRTHRHFLPTFSDSVSAHKTLREGHMVD